MKHQPSLKLFLGFSFLLIAVVLVIGYSMLSAHFYRRGMDTVTATVMEKAAKRYLIEHRGVLPRQPILHRGYLVGGNWHTMAPELLAAFGEKQPEPGLSVQEVRDSWFGPPARVYFLFHLQHPKGSLFISSRGTREMIPAIMSRDMKQSMMLLLTIAGSTALTLGVLGFLLFQRVSRPVTALGSWARDLNEENLSAPIPDFSYPELNEFAQLVRASLSSAQQGLIREQNFLRHASHELRTPIAVIRNNIELLRKFEENPANRSKDISHQVISRIDRASLNMQYLTETLLWLSRDEIDGLPKTEIELDRMIETLADENRYLLDKKPVELVMETEPWIIHQPEYPVRIVLGNLIRNSFQHSQEDRVHIAQKNEQVFITNTWNFTDDQTKDSNQDLGFGLGLKLCKLLTEKLGWTYRRTTTGTQYRVELHLHPSMRTNAELENMPDITQHNQP